MQVADPIAQSPCHYGDVPALAPSAIVALILMSEDALKGGVLDKTYSKLMAKGNMFSVILIVFQDDVKCLTKHRPDPLSIASIR